jgi:phosphotransferase system HPr (HPr) family protein
MGDFARKDLGLGIPMDHNAESATVGPLRQKVRITNPQGFHMRPGRAFVELAGQFRSSVRINRDGSQSVDGKSLMELLLLGAEPGTELTVEVEGPDAPAALAALVDLLANLESRVDLESPD